MFKENVDKVHKNMIIICILLFTFFFYFLFLSQTHVNFVEPENTVQTIGKLSKHVFKCNCLTGFA